MNRERASRVSVRELGAGDHDALFVLCAAVLEGYSENVASNPGAPAAFLEDGASFVLGAYVEEAPVGVAWGLQMRSPSGRLTSYLHELSVREPWRRQGVATALMRAAMRLGRRRGSTRFWLSTGGQNAGAQALYEALGGDRKPLGDVNYWWSLE